MSTEWIAPKGWTPKPPPPPKPPPTPEQVKLLLAEALVQAMRGEPMMVARAVEQASGAIADAGLHCSEVLALAKEIATEWAQGKGPDVPPYVPPVVAVAVVEKPEPREPEPKEVP